MVTEPATDTRISAFYFALMVSYKIALFGFYYGDWIVMKERSLALFAIAQIVYSICMIVWIFLEFYFPPIPMGRLPETVLLLVIPISIISIVLAFITLWRPNQWIWSAWIVRWVLGFFVATGLYFTPLIWTGGVPPPPPRILPGVYFESIMGVISLIWLVIDRKKYL